MMCAHHLRQQAILESLLQRTGYSGLNGVECRVMECRVVLTGQVPTYYLKQVAQRVIVDHLQSTQSLDNQLTVADVGSLAPQ